MVIAPEGSPAADSCRALGLPLLEIARGPEGSCELVEAMSSLYRMGIGSVLVEGGTTVHSAFFKRGLYDAVTVFCSPLILGGGDAAVEGMSPALPEAGMALADAKWTVGNGYIRLDAKGCGPCSRA